MAEDVSLPQALDAIGGRAFAPRLLQHLSAAVGAHHCVLYRFGTEDLQVVGYASVDGTDMAGRNSARYARDFFHRDTVFQALRSRLSGYRSELECVATEGVSDAEFRREMFDLQRLSGRAMMVGERNGTLYGVSMFRDRETGFFTAQERAVIRDTADLLVSCVAKHHVLLARDDVGGLLFSSVEQLEIGLSSLPSITRREREVCARILFGLSMKEIARALGISVESGDTYRKRAYLRLQVGSRAELHRRLLGQLSSDSLAGADLLT